MGGAGKTWHPKCPRDSFLRCFRRCAHICDALEQCTAFEFNAGGHEGFNCGTYTGGSANVATTHNGDMWSSSCVKVKPSRVEPTQLSPPHPLSSPLLSPLSLPIPPSPPIPSPLPPPAPLPSPMSPSSLPPQTALSPLSSPPRPLPSLPLAPVRRLPASSHASSQDPTPSSEIPAASGLLDGTGSSALMPSLELNEASFHTGIGLGMFLGVAGGILLVLTRSRLLSICKSLCGQRLLRHRRFFDQSSVDEEELAEHQPKTPLA
jgi:hypothetical protein